MSRSNIVVGLSHFLALYHRNAYIVQAFSARQHLPNVQDDDLSPTGDLSPTEVFRGLMPTKRAG